MKADIRKIYNHCLEAIGGDANEDVSYLKTRPKLISRESFFQEAVWAVWVSGMGRKGTETFLKKAERYGFSWDFRRMQNWNYVKWKRFLIKLHGNHCPPRAQKKWQAVREIAKSLGRFSTERDFRKAFFGGKTRSRDLNNDDVQRVLNLRLPFIGWANSHFVIRNMGGQAIKCDRWIDAFLTLYKLTQRDLEALLRHFKISLTLFDAAIWGYCEKYVKRVSRLSHHFGKAFA
jgi:hypothetical protein